MSDDVRGIPRGSVSRTARLASLPLGAAGRATLGIGKRLSGRSPEAVTAELQQRTAEQLFAVLGQLKGGAMKLGQTLSVFEAAVPDEVAAPYREALVKLQEEAPPMPVLRRWSAHPACGCTARTEEDAVPAPRGCPSPRRQEGRRGHG